MPKLIGLGITPSPPTHSVLGDGNPTRNKVGKKKQHGTQFGQKRTSAVKQPSPSPLATIESFELFNMIDQMGEQLTTVMATVIQLQSDVQRLKDRLP